MGHTLSGSAPRNSKTTCRACDRTVHLVPGGEPGELVAVDPELIAVVPGERTPSTRRGQVGEQIVARRVHAELCDMYQRESAAKKLRDEMRSYTKAHAPSAGKKRRPSGL
jgi:hypothetical protein